MGKLYFGDNLDVLRKHVKDESVDLIYLDPPFNSNASYNLLYKSPLGVGEDAQVRAFKDTWNWEEDCAEQALDELRTRDVRVFSMLQSLRGFMGESDVMAYLVMMAIRLVEMHRVIKDTGTLYLHCDPAASHYLKIVLDAIFGPDRFVNEIVWERTNTKGHAFTRFSSSHDIIFHYRKTDKAVWNPQFNPLSESYIQSHYANVEAETGRRYSLGDCLNPNPDRPNLTYEWNGHTRVWRWTKDKMQANHDAGRLVYTRTGMPRYKRYLDEGKGTPVSDVWTDIFPLNSQAQERLGYPTQKPLALLERIIKASSNEGDVVLDPFCGCGTTVHAAQTLNRQWIGIDVAYAAVKVVEDRLATHFPNLKYEVSGIPTGEVAARALAKMDPYTFQQWAVAKLGGQPRGRGADRGIDGEIIFLKGARSYGRALVSVKAGKNVNPDMVRSLLGVVENERADLGFFVCVDGATDEMRRVASMSGRVDVPGGRRPKLQIVTVKDLIDGPKIGIVTGLNVFQASKAAAAEKRKRPAKKVDVKQLPLPPMAIAGGKSKEPPATRAKKSAAAAPRRPAKRVRKQS